jgi:hypothetical protein
MRVMKNRVLVIETRVPSLCFVKNETVLLVWKVMFWARFGLYLLRSEIHQTMITVINFFGIRWKNQDLSEMLFDHGYGNLDK